MSVKTSVDELYGDSKSEDWKAEEVQRIKEEQGIAGEEENRSLTMWTLLTQKNLTITQMMKKMRKIMQKNRKQSRTERYTGKQ